MAPTAVEVAPKIGNRGRQKEPGTRCACCSAYPARNPCHTRINHPRPRVSVMPALPAVTPDRGLAG